MQKSEKLHKNTLISYFDLPIHTTIILFFLLVCIISTVPAQNPTPQEIAQNWRALSPQHAGKIVYLTRESDEVMVIDLSTGVSQKIADYAVAKTSFGVSGSVKWSPDGNRITMQNDSTVKVMNADGSGMATVAEAVLKGDLIVNSWSGNNKIVYSIGDTIIRAEIGADNTVLSKELLVSDPPEGGRGYCSVTMSGDYLAYIDVLANLPNKGGHRPLVLHVPTGELRDMVPRTSDGCQLRIKPNGSGTVVYCEWTHYAPAIVKNWDGEKIDSIPVIKDTMDNKAIQHMRWSNDTSFMTIMGAPVEPKYAWILRTTDKEWMYLGDEPYHPDLWVNPQSAISHQVSGKYGASRISITRLSSGIMRIATDINTRHEIRLFNPKGSLLFSGTADGFSPCFVPLSKLNQGLYIITVRTTEKVFVYKKPLIGK